ncbi:MAG: hypothetical protein Q8Q59_04955, partial [Luteolibacter sp.]|nr:hypothetical protein [Luteolibacter sp.]
MKPAFNRLSRLSQITLAAAALTTGIAFASPVAWTGTGTDALWSTDGNWSPSGVPTGADDVTVGPTYTSGLTITVGGTAGTPTQINSLAFDTGTSGGNKFLASGYLQINTGNVTTAGNQAGWLDTTSIDIPATGSGVNNWIVGAGSTLRVRGNIAVIGGSGTPTITATGATGSLNLDKTPQSYAGNWDISTQSLTVKSFGSGAVKVSNVKWYTSAATSNTYSNDFTFGGFARMQAGATQTLTFDGVWTGTASDILFNTDGGGTSTGATIKLAGTPTSFTANTFQVIGTLQLDTAGYLTGVGAVALNRGNILTYGIVNWNAADTVPATTTFNNTQASTAAQLGMLATGTTTINGLYKLNSSATVTDGSDLTINTAVS